MSDTQSIRLAVVMERRPLDNPWVSESWLPVGLVPDFDDGDGPRCIHDSEGVSRWVFPRHELMLSREECEGYWQNLVSPGARIFVLWRIEDELAVPQRITASYDEASAWMDAGESVEGVSMPDDVAAWVGDYLKEHFRPERKKRIRPQSFKNPRDRVGS